MIKQKFQFLALVIGIGQSYLFAVDHSKTSSQLTALKLTAVAQNSEVQVLEHALKESTATLDRTYAPFYPGVGIAGGANTELSPQEKQTVGVGYLYGHWNLFRGFGDAYRLEIANLEVKKAETRLARAKFRVGLEVEEAYYRISLINTSMELRKKALLLNEGHKKYARKRKESGLVTDSDVMEFELREAILQSDLALLEQQREEARIQLGQILGSAHAVELGSASRLEHRHLKANLEDLKKRLNSDGESVWLANTDLKIAEFESRLWRTRLYPEIDLEAKAGYLPIDERPTGGGTSFRGLALVKWDLFSGFDTVNQRQEGSSRRLKAEALLKNVVLNSGAQLEVLYSKIKAIEVRLHLEEQNEARAQKYYDAVMKDYRRGVKNSSDVKSAAEGYFDASLRRETFRYDFVAEKIAIEKLLGSEVSVEVLAEHPVSSR